MPTQRNDPSRPVLVVEDQEDLREVWTAFLTRRGDRVVSAGRRDQALQMLSGGLAPCAAILDWSLADGDADSLVTALLRVVPRCTIVVVTGHGHDIDELVSKPDVVVLHKPFALRELASALDR
jgi:DNA-binding NtrC family response regulator